MTVPNAPAWDYLSLDGGWLTAEGIAMEIGMSAESVYRSMWRWRKAGHVESRSVGLAYAGGVTANGSRVNRGQETRREWRTL